MQVVAICPHDSAPHPTGYYFFEAETLEEHNRNAAKWRALRRERGEM